MEPFTWTSKAGRPARTYIQQLFGDTDCSLDDLPRSMDDREGWLVRVKEICAVGKTWWWWWWWWEIKLIQNENRKISKYLDLASELKKQTKQLSMNVTLCLITVVRQGTIPKVLWPRLKELVLNHSKTESSGEVPVLATAESLLCWFYPSPPNCCYFLGSCLWVI